MNYRILVLMIFVLSFLIGCGEDNPANSSKSPQITSISPNQGKAGDAITIRGKNFDSIQGLNFILFNHIQYFAITSWSNTEINFRNPGSKNSGKIKVSVSVNSLKSNEVDFTVTEPLLYESVSIGSQIWRIRNLDVSTYRNGETIRHAESNEDWIDAGNKKEGAWCYYNNDPAMGAVYGKLYNWFAVNDPRNLAPKGWHIPSNTEWTILTDYLGGAHIAGGKMKEANLSHWKSPNTGATNSSGFTALSSAYRYYDGYFLSLSYCCYWWSASEYKAATAWYRGLSFDSAYMDIYNISKVQGFSVRCIKD